MKFARVTVVTAGALVLGAVPAGAATPVLADERYKWFYWIAPILAASFVLLVLGLSVGYFRKVVIPRHRGRRAE